MKRPLILIFLLVTRVLVFADPQQPVTVNSELNKYRYVYVIPTNGITYTSSYVYTNPYGVYNGSTKTINPSEIISGYLMQYGFTVLPAIDPDLIEETLVVSYGQTGGFSEQDSEIIIQITDAKTHKVVTSFTAECNGLNDVEAINDAIHQFCYSLYPEVVVKVQENQKNKIKLRKVNKTPSVIQTITVRLKYYNKEKMIHEQTAVLNERLSPGEDESTVVKKDKIASNQNYTIEVEVESYE